MRAVDQKPEYHLEWPNPHTLEELNFAINIISIHNTLPCLHTLLLLVKTIKQKRGRNHIKSVAS